ncbi:MAG: hypothetical protein ACT4PW_01260 [Acidimicrobiia bacterium]
MAASFDPVLAVRGVVKPWAWLVPPVLLGAVWSSSGWLTWVAAGLALLAFADLVADRPERWLLALVVVLPFQQVLLSWLYGRGVPAGAVRALGYWKEGVCAGLALAALRHSLRRRAGLDRIDVVALAYVAVVAAYWWWPRLFVHPTGPFSVGPPTDTATLLVAARTAAGFVALFVVVRRLDLSPVFARTLARTVVAVGAVVAAVAVVEFMFSDRWNAFVVDTLRVPAYRAEVLEATNRNVADIRIYSQVGGRDVLRVGSVFLDQMACAFYLVAALALALARDVRTRTTYALAGLLGAAVVLTQTRAAILAVLVVLVCLRRPGSTRARDRVPAVLLAVGLAAIVALALSSGLAQRTTSAVGGEEESTQLHLERTTKAAGELFLAPLGRGLGTAGATGNRFEVETTLTSEDYYLQVGNETGALSMVAFVSLVVLVARRLKKSAVGATSITARGSFAALVGLSAGAVLLPLWTDVAVSWTVWATLAATVGSAPAPARRAAILGRTGRSDMELRRYVALLGRRWPVLVAGVVAAAAAGYLVTPDGTRYTSQSTIMVGTPDLSGDPSIFGVFGDRATLLDRLTLTYAVLVDTGPVAEGAARRTGVARDVATILEATRAEAPAGTQLVRVRVSDRDPAVAQALADGMAEAFADQVAALGPAGVGDAGSVQVVERAGTATATPEGNREANVAVGAILGLLAAIGLVLLLEYLDTTVRDGDDAERRLELPLLGVVPFAAGVDRAADAVGPAPHHA